MENEYPEFRFEQIHIDVARNATDDFNLFHDPHKWHEIKNNPFNGPIVLGFQLVSLVEHMVARYRESNDEHRLITDKNLRFSNFQFTFANAVKPGECVNVEIKKSQLVENEDGTVLSNRIALKTNGKLALMGYKKESDKPLFMINEDVSIISNLMKVPDRSYLDNGFFLKRKFMNTSNGKNFLCGCFTDQSLFFDELNDIAHFPEIFPCSLISCALLEKALKNKHNFKENPMVYTSHKLTVDRELLQQLKSNNALHMLTREMPDQPDSYECFGLIHDNRILFQGIISLTSLQSILKPA